MSNNGFSSSVYYKSIRDKIIVQLIWTVIVAVITFVVGYLISIKFSFSTLELILLLLLLMFVIGIVSYIIYRRTNRRLPIFNPLECDFRMLKEEKVHKWIDKDNYVHIRRYKLKALKNGLSSYTDKFQWSGKEYSMSGGNTNYKIEKHAKSKNVFELYEFKFTTPLKKGEEIEVEVKWKAIGPAKPFFSTTIEEPTDLLIMSIMLYPDCGITTVNCDTESYKGSKLPLVSEKRDLNSEGEYLWQIENPRLLYHYEINW